MAGARVRVGIVAAVCCLAPFSSAKTFGPLDPQNTNPKEFYHGVQNPVPVSYVDMPRYPVVPTEGDIAFDVVDTLYPKAKPTNIWQKNLWSFPYSQFDQSQTWGAINAYPYEIQVRNEQLLVGYTGPPGNKEVPNMWNQFQTVYPQSPPPGKPLHNASYSFLVPAEVFDIGVFFPDTHVVPAKLTQVGAEVHFNLNSNNNTVAKMYFVKGSPFVNIECTNAKIAFGSKWVGTPPINMLNGQGPVGAITDTHFHLQAAENPTVHPYGIDWHYFFESDVTVNFNAPTGFNHLESPYSGLFQIGCGDMDDRMGNWLAKNRGVYATGADVKYNIDGDMGSVIFDWEVKTTQNASDKDLAMLAIPHHKELMKGVKFMPTSYWCIKGNMTAVSGSQWTMNYKLTDVGFGEKKKVNPSMKPVLKEQLEYDFNMFTKICPGDEWAGDGSKGYEDMELYAYVRDLASMMDIAVTAEALGERSMGVKMTQHVLKCMNPVINGTNRDPMPCPPPINGSHPPTCLRSQQDIYYDEKWGGLITSWYTRFAAHYCQCDKAGPPTACQGYNYCDNPTGWTGLGNYGNALYNDHHFQYGYVVKALAWAIYYQKQLGASIVPKGMLAGLEKRALLFARDYANPDQSGDPEFPYLRHKDLYDGHSWAEGYDYSGRVNNWINQQSGGEAVNSYYAVYLLGVALGDDNVKDWGRIHAASEMQSLSIYQMVSNGTEAERNTPAKDMTDSTRCISILKGNSVDGSTYWGQAPLFECGITMLPFTPITKEYIDPKWAGETYKWLQWKIQANGVCTFPDPKTMKTNPCHGQNNPPTWFGNAWGCCGVGGADLWDNDWRAFPDWYPFMYMMMGYNDTQAAWSKLQVANQSEPTSNLPFPYTYTFGGVTQVVGFQKGWTRTQALWLLSIL